MYYPIYRTSGGMPHDCAKPCEGAEQIKASYYAGHAQGRIDVDIWVVRIDGLLDLEDLVRRHPPRGSSYSGGVVLHPGNHYEYGGNPGEFMIEIYDCFRE